MSRPKLLLSTYEVMDRTGVSFRRLDYWARRGIVAASVGANGSGSSRRWSEDDVARVIEVRDAMVKAFQILDDVGIEIPAAWAGRRRQLRRQHGLARYQQDGCRCAICRGANATMAASYR